MLCLNESPKRQNEIHKKKIIFSIKKTTKIHHLTFNHQRKKRQTKSLRNLNFINKKQQKKIEKEKNLRNSLKDSQQSKNDF